MLKSIKYLWLFLSLNIAFQLISDVTANRLVNFGDFTTSVTVLYFPITYIISDVIVEVYGFKVARISLYMTLLSSIIAGLIFQLILLLPSPGFTKEITVAYEMILSSTPRILIAGWLAVFGGDMINNYVMIKMIGFFNVWFLPLRTITSTIIGQLVNSIIFYTIAFYHILDIYTLTISILFGSIFKIGVEIIFTPITVIVINLIKRKELPKTL